MKLVFRHFRNTRDRKRKQRTNQKLTCLVFFLLLLVFVFLFFCFLFFDTRSLFAWAASTLQITLADPRTGCFNSTQQLHERSPLNQQRQSQVSSSGHRKTKAISKVMVSYTQVFLCDTFQMQRTHQQLPEVRDSGGRMQWVCVCSSRGYE